MELPFDDDSFDVVTHSGGINTFSDIPAALREWVRVLKPNGFLWIGDEGISPALRKTRRGAEIMKENKLFGLQPPLRHLPPQVKNISLQWLARDTFYTISCQKLSEEELRDLSPLKVWFTAEI
jgi:ubiquinone/menaquinone biosynthesis C-methylase UbiE